MTMINLYSTRQLRDAEFDEDSDLYFDYKHHAWWEWDISEKLDITAEKELLMGWDTPEHDRARDKFPKIFDAVQTFDISGWNPVDDGKTSKADELSRLIKLFTDTADF